ncbi:hypothetical protein AV530_003180 [Patagioenas fasciata monilis]|uniref:Uncharacterized protein n=1 Tax=Patagioenas fasciata monilis TaxID=372326 RepID=A0A1V4KWD5_PATFA|nr:hypothetical protein AV530_003180 [Patagioenas fasciata monilis]
MSFHWPMSHPDTEQRAPGSFAVGFISPVVVQRPGSKARKTTKSHSLKSAPVTRQKAKPFTFFGCLNSSSSPRPERLSSQKASLIILFKIIHLFLLSYCTWNQRLCLIVSMRKSPP